MGRRKKSESLTDAIELTENNSAEKDVIEVDGMILEIEGNYKDITLTDGNAYIVEALKRGLKVNILSRKGKWK